MKQIYAWNYTVTLLVAIFGRGYYFLPYIEAISHLGILGNTLCIKGDLCITLEEH